MSIYFNMISVFSSMKKWLTYICLSVFLVSGFYQCEASAASMNAWHSTPQRASGNFTLKSFHNSTIFAESNQDNDDSDGHSWPTNHCVYKRRHAYQSSMSSVVSCAAFAACSIDFFVCFPLWAGLAIACEVSLAVMSGFLGAYDKCCRKLKKNSEFGLPSDGLRKGAMCNDCMSSKDILKDKCNA